MSKRGLQEGSPKAIRAELAARLRARAPEIENAILARIQALEPVGDEDQAYVVGLESAVAAALRFGLEGIERGGEWVASIPREAADLARHSARRGVRLETVLRSYTAGNKTLEEFILNEADGIPSQVLCQVLSNQGDQVDRFMKAVAAEHRDELHQVSGSPKQRKARRVLRLLGSSTLVEPTDLDYDFDTWHLGTIIWSQSAEKAALIIAEHCGCRSLRVPGNHETVWMWLSSTDQARLADLVEILSEHVPANTSLAVGEPRNGLDGWRLTHREAQMALQMTMHKPRRLTRGRDVILLASAMRDDTLVSSLFDTYLKPLEEYGSASQTLLASLRAYFSSNGNAAAAASSLGLTRQTVQRHIATVEQVIGRPLQACYVELYVALQIRELSRFQGPKRTPPLPHQVLAPL